MRIRTPAVIPCILALLLSGCASTRPQKLPETMKQACSLYQDHRPDVLKARQFARDNWASIPPEAQKVLVQLDQILPALDAIGQATCDLSTLTLPIGFTWDTTLSVILKAIQIALDMRTKGLI